MKQAVTINIYGLKCDAPECDYTDETAKYEDYPQYVNKPCPKCGANLLTEEDMRTCQTMQAAAAIVNQVCGELPEKEPEIMVVCEMDGSGSLNPKVVTENGTKG